MTHQAPLLDPAEAYALWAASYPPHAHNPLMLAEEQAMLALLPGDLRGRMVLDAGCGSGRYLLQMMQRGAAWAVGVDLSAEMLARAASLELRQGSNARYSRREKGQLEGQPLQKSPHAHCKVERTFLKTCLRVKSSEVPKTLNSQLSTLNSHLIRASLDAIPLRGGWADLTVCGLTLGHLEDLRRPLAELCRVTRPGGTLLCSDFHPIGYTLGWRREFKAGGRRYAVRHTPHQYDDWQRACRDLGLRIERVLEPRLDPAGIPTGASFDPAALEVPVALVFELRR